jgi:hypothetical protein
LTSDADLKRSRRDRAFRQELLGSQLQALITAMAALKATPDAADGLLAGQLREGADLVVKLADILKQLAAEAGKPPQAA